ncbi:MAG: ABC transporter permease [Kurthia sp.]|uniref:ABC-2 family transporter protein n=1 Tax=Kurthia zopfii TaxID=1650 RepID=A0A8B4QBR5_9BACL|nr:ABC transporter permease [Kurthia zopfii]PWI24025.1 sodium ABC transporter permease [Kurthia zopfii]TDR44279.1 ABC-2 type transport system permease protein [Kurthia zopfii]GEK29765.1 sodium ABC transporter permease [Kurthia zopfii]STX10115.1 ABC-2 family transporter protein [Kurthia zopfii]
MSKLMLLVKQLYKQKVTSKSFIGLTILYLAIIAVVFNWSSIKDVFKSDDSNVKIAFVDETKANLYDQFPSSDDLMFMRMKDSEEVVNKRVKKGEVDAALYLKDEKGKLVVKLATADSLDLEIQSTINQLAENAGKIYSVQKMNLTPEQAKQILETQTLVKQVDLSETVASKTSDEKSAGILVAYIIGFLIYIFVTSYMSMITTDIASEKGSRVLEVLMASVKPSTHLFSKLIGVFLTGMTQIILLFAGAFTIAKFSSKSELVNGASSMMKQLSPSYFIYVSLFFVLSIILFLIIGALAGSLVSKVDEASQVMMPGIFITLIGFYVMISGMGNPDSMLIKVFSFIPFTSGMVMTLRMGATDVSNFYILVSLITLAVTVMALFAISLTFYKRSVLTYSTGGIIQKIKTVLKVTT